MHFFDAVTFLVEYFTLRYEEIVSDRVPFQKNSGAAPQMVVQDNAFPVRTVKLRPPVTIPLSGNPVTSLPLPARGNAHLFMLALHFNGHDRFQTGPTAFGWPGHCPRQRRQSGGGLVVSIERAKQ